MNCSPSEVSVGEVFATPENILSETMAHEMNNDIENSSELKELVELAMNDFGVSDVTMWRTQHVDRDLKAIWNKLRITEALCST